MHAAFHPLASHPPGRGPPLQCAVWAPSKKRGYEALAGVTGVTMPLTMRPIPHALNLGAPEIYGQGPTGQGTQGTQVLEDVNMASMVGTLAQLGALATVRERPTTRGEALQSGSCDGNLMAVEFCAQILSDLLSHHQKSFCSHFLSVRSFSLALDTTQTDSSLCSRPVVCLILLYLREQGFHGAGVPI